MILALDNEHFLEFGERFLQDEPNYGFAPGVSTRVRRLQAIPEKICGFCLPEDHGYMCCGEGRAVLAVSTDKATFSYFFLDQPVFLKPGVYFALIPFSQLCTATLRTPKNAELERFFDWKGLEEFPSVQQLRVKNVLELTYQETERGYFFKGESHRALELTYVCAGGLHCVAEGMHWTLHPGEMLILDRAQWHMCYCDVDVRAAFFSVSFDLESVELTDRVFACNAQSFLWQMMEEKKRGDGFSHSLCVCLLQQLLLTALRENPARLPAVPNNENTAVCQAQRYIAAHIYERMTVGTVAEAVDLSASYLSALFHKCLGLSPGEYIRRARLEESKRFLREGALNITKIAEMLQYSTVHHFSRQFKEKYGLTPSQYAKSLQ